MPPQAIDLYETLRTQVLGGGRCRSGLSAVRYHGMARGLALLAKTPTHDQHEQATHTRSLPTVENDPALVRLLTNMVLRIQSEVQHVY